MVIATKNRKSGGSSANKNGLAYEVSTELEYMTIQLYKYHKVITFTLNGKKFIKIDKGNLYKYFDKKIDKTIGLAHGCKRPDECYINEDDKVIFIIEKKFQKVDGSVCEKIQSVDFKNWHFKKIFKDYKVVYIYCLSNWFKNNCKPELEYLKFKDIPVLFGSNVTYKEDMISIITNYK
ncbi:conserved hypothetical protein [Gammaproteobacteria bacterium]